MRQNTETIPFKKVRSNDTRSFFNGDIFGVSTTVPAPSRAFGMETALNAAGLDEMADPSLRLAARLCAPGESLISIRAATAANTSGSMPKPQPASVRVPTPLPVGSSGLTVTNRLAARRMTVHDGLLAACTLEEAAHEIRNDWPFNSRPLNS